MNTPLIKKALQEQADVHKGEAYRQLGSNVLRRQILHVLDRYLDDPEEGLLDDLEKVAAACGRNAMWAYAKGVELEAEAEKL